MARSDPSAWNSPTFTRAVPKSIPTNWASAGTLLTAFPPLPVDKAPNCVDKRGNRGTTTHVALDQLGKKCGGARDNFADSFPTYPGYPQPSPGIPQVQRKPPGRIFSGAGRLSPLSTPLLRLPLHIPSKKTDLL